MPSCTEGSLAWVARSALPGLDVIENTARVLGFVLDDLDRAATGIRCGAATVDDRGQFVDLTFG